MVAKGVAPKTGNPDGKKLKPSTRGMMSRIKRTNGTNVAATTDSVKRLRLLLIELFICCFIYGGIGGVARRRFTCGGGRDSSCSSGDNGVELRWTGAGAGINSSTSCSSLL